MNVFNKVELIGIFASIGVMALLLGFFRFKGETVAQVIPEGKGQSAVVVVRDDKEKPDTLEEVKQALENSMTSSGKLVELVIDDVVIGKGDEVKEGDTVFVHYEGKLQDGTRFDSSYERGQPFSFTVGGGRVIEGWEKGLLGMKVGGKRVLVIPSDMAYGNRQVGPIPPNSPLVFSIELTEIK
jgi:FKBP-type peptidyl-prolyl cis-trans isomerase